MARSRETSEAPALARGATALRTTGAVHCLIVAADEARRENLGFAAREGGWDITRCDDPEQAMAQARQRPLHMAIIDLSGSTGISLGAPPQTSSLRFLIEHLACTSRMLLLICGNLDDPCEEVWARHLGVWMYLPGAIDGAELVTLCVAARETVERLANVDRSPPGRTNEKKLRSS